jgi:uncharacterized membrane protein YqjE
MEPQPRPVEPVPRPPDPAPAPAAAPGGEPGIVDTAKRMLDEGGDAAHTAMDTARALKTLAATELALAKVAIVRSAVMFGGAAVAALVSLFFVFATLSAVLVALGLSWWAALGISTLLLLATAGLLAWRGMSLVKLARFDATRRQLARIRETMT